MRIVDGIFGATRGLIQGTKRGFYKEYTFEISPRCFGGESEILGFKIFSILAYLEWAKIYEIPMYSLSLYEMFVQDCQIQEFLFDIISFCGKHGCTVSQLWQNEINSALIITGVVNAVVAIIYNFSEYSDDNMGNFHD